MSPHGSIPLGPERKDPPWRWGSFFIGICSFVVLAWIATLGDIALIDWWWFVSLALGALFSLRFGLAWRRGRDLGRRPGRAVEPTIDVRGESGSTYVLVEAPRGSGKGGRGPRPREFTPFWWALYSITVRAPVALGDFVLTFVWRAFDGFRTGGTSDLARELELHPDAPEYREGLRRPDREGF